MSNEVKVQAGKSVAEITLELTRILINAHDGPGNIHATREDWIRHYSAARVTVSNVTKTEIRSSLEKLEKPK